MERLTPPYHLLEVQEKEPILSNYLLQAGLHVGAMKYNAPQLKIVLPADSAIDAEVDLAFADSVFSLQARLNVVLPGLTYEEAKTVVEAAHQTCPYSKATRGNINVQINVAI